MAKIYCIVGCSGSGKSDYIKSKILPACKKHLILDVNKEYTDFKCSSASNIISFFIWIIYDIQIIFIYQIKL